MWRERVEMPRAWLRWEQRGRVSGAPPVAAALSLLAAFAVSLSLAGCGYVAANASLTPAQSQQFTTLARDAAAPDSSNVQTALGDNGAVTVTVTVGWTPRIGIGDIAKEQERVKAICFREQQALWTSGLPLHSADVVVLGPVQDDYADMTLDAHAEARLSATTAASLAWASLTPDTAWSKYDSVWLRATYQPHVVGS